MILGQSLNFRPPLNCIEPPSSCMLFFSFGMKNCHQGFMTSWFEGKRTTFYFPWNLEPTKQLYFNAESEFKAHFCFAVIRIDVLYIIKALMRSLDIYVYCIFMFAAISLEVFFVWTFSFDLEVCHHDVELLRLLPHHHVAHWGLPFRSLHESRIDHSGGSFAAVSNGLFGTNLFDPQAFMTVFQPTIPKGFQILVHEKCHFKPMFGPVVNWIVEFDPWCVCCWPEGSPLLIHSTSKIKY